MIPRAALRVRALDVPLRNAFTIARGTSASTRLVFLRLQSHDETGWGEGAPSVAVSGESAADTSAALARVRPALLDEAPADALAHFGDAPPAARAALDIALHDLRARLDGLPVRRLLDCPPGARPTFCTVSLADPAAMAAEAAAWVARGARALKVKLGRGAEDVARFSAVRAAAPGVPCAADANEGWSPEEAPRLAAAVADLGAVFIEQPVRRGDAAALAAVQRATPVPVVADEDVRGPGDVARLAAAAACQAVNVKVQKVGGLLAARACIEAARDAGLKVLVGCNLETGLGVAAGAQFAGLADWLDLDAHLLLAADPFAAPWGAGAEIGPLETPGLGVRPERAFVQAFLAPGT